MGLETKFVASQEPLHQHYTCGVCEELVDLDCLITTACSHVACRRCLAKHLAVEKSCPTCHQGFVESTHDGGNKMAFANFVQPLQLCQPLAYRVLQDFQVCCPLPSLNCGWKGRYADLRLHLLDRAAHVVSTDEKVPRCSTTTSSPVRSHSSRSLNVNRHKAKRAPNLDDVTETTEECSNSCCSEGSWSTDEEASHNFSPIPPPELPGSPKPTATPTSTTTKPLASHLTRSAHRAPPATNNTTTPTPPLRSSSTHAPSTLERSPSRRSVGQICEYFKEEGNKHFLQQNYRAASGLYTRGINFLAARRAKSLDTEHATPLEATLLNNRAACYYAMQNYHEAACDSQSALKLDPTYEKASLRLVRSYVALGNFSTALKACQGACQRAKPAAPSAVLQEMLTQCKALNQAHLDALLFVEEGHYEMAKAKVALLLPESRVSSVLLLSAQADLGAGYTDEAITTCDQVLQAEPQSTKAQLLRGQAAILAGKEEEGRKFIKDALRMDPDSGASAQTAKPWLQVAHAIQEMRAALDQSRWEDALQISSDTLRDCPLLPAQAPLFATLHAARAQAYVGTGKHEAALQECTRVLSKQQHAQHAETWLAHLSALYELGRYGEAMEEVSRIQAGWGRNDNRFAKHHCKIQGTLDMRPDFYSILGVSRTASERELQKAYSLKSRKCHPDRFMKASPEKQKEAAEQFQKLNEALEFLTDDFMRKQYDEGQDLKTIRQRAFIRSKNSNRE